MFNTTYAGKPDMRQITRMAVIVAITGVLMESAPAFAFESAASTIVSQTNKAISAAQKILVAAAVLALIVGIAPMLWGQVKVKWMVSCLVACILFSVAPAMITAFASG